MRALLILVVFDDDIELIINVLVIGCVYEKCNFGRWVEMQNSGYVIYNWDFCFVSKVYSNSNVFVLVNKFELNLHLKLCFIGLGPWVVWMVIECVFGGY